MASSQLVQHVRPQSYYEVEEDELISESIQKQTESVFYEFVDERSEEDPELTFHQKIVLHNSASACIRESGEVQGQGDIAVKVAHILRNYGDEFQARFEQDVVLKDALGQAFLDTDTGKPNVETALSHIKTVVERLFDVDINGVARSINIGRIAAIFYYCYTLCKSFIMRVFPNHNIREFLFSLGGYLVASFVRVQFYQWLSDQGGWRQGIVSLFSSNYPPWTNNLLLVGGVILIGLWSYRWYKGFN